ncbi:MAG: type II secretion system protein [Candidatus Saccharibacteria bacterium]|nr:type II secretion system protein [Candidatus Saccharibacteria bacterium]
MRIFNQRGDTLTEVMFATAVAALVIVLALGAMNRSFAETQMSVEKTFVRQSMDTEAELLRFARDQYKDDPTGSGGKLWRDVVAQSKSDASPFGTCFNKDPAQSINLPPKSFFVTNTDLNDVKINSTVTDFKRPETFAGIGQGVWVEAVKGHERQGITYLDLHIRACWEPPYSGPDATLGTIVRLYYEDN